MLMEKRWCGHCLAQTWHNPSGKKENPFRCTVCAQPVGTGPKRERNEAAGRAAKKRSY